MENGHCKKCGQPLIQESKHIVGLFDDEGHGPYKLKYQITLTCPRYLKPFGWLVGHDRLIVEHHD